jgi:hypothetical protein
MKIGYNKAIGICMFIPSLLSCCLVAVLTQSDQTAPLGAVGAFWMGILFGILFLTQPYFEVTQNELMIKALIGTAARRIPFSSPRDFSVEGKAIYITQGGTRQKVNLVPWLADKKGWDAFIAWINA